AALTGPAARNDSAAVRAHLRALSEADGEIARSYRALSTRTAECVGADAVRKVVDEP
ncbi:MAG: DUF2520 domain-containing protein, partial [Mycobacterium sp.]|nr:DUF2520 domain-containing protein [Mycobacterium sp.]